MALNEHSELDLQVLADQLLYESQKNPGLVQEWLPTLLAPPKAYWQKSEKDFSSNVFDTLKRTFPNNQRDFIQCAECSQNRSFVAHDGRLVIENGELSLLALNNLKSHQNFQHAKSLMAINETASGIEIRVISLSHGQVLFSKLADHSKTLDNAQRPLNLARELERRENGQAISYVFIDWGFHPKSLFQIEFLEQWGARNQHLSGLNLSFVEPVGAIGASYHYLIPANRKFNIGVSLFVALDGLTGSSSSRNSPWGVVTQGKIQYAFSGNYAAFASINTKGGFSVGITFLNPVLFPFLL